jgi:hypothetical protein
MQQDNYASANNDQTCGDILQPAIARWSNGGNNAFNIYIYLFYGVYNLQFARLW